jgi:transcriptional regulator with XRE-family HTH domain
MIDSFGARLRAIRERKGIGLDAIARSTKISVALFEALERDDPSRWPSGIFRRAFIRAYAKEVGLDPESTVQEFVERFPDHTADPFVAASDRESSDAASAGRSSADAAGLRLTLADERLPLLRAPVNLLSGLSPRVSAAIYDLAIVIAVAAAVFATIGRFWTPFGVAAVCYYFGGVLILGNSPGGWLVARARGIAGSGRRQPAAPPPSTTANAAVDDVENADNLRQFNPRRYRKAV